MAESRRIPRWIKIVVSSVLALVVVFYIAGGIVFSNMIKADALTPEGPTQDYGVYVTAIESDSITLTSQEERGDTVQPGVAGLIWDDGYGALGSISSVDGLEVTRSFRVIDGVAPEPCVGELSSCDPVDIDGWVYRTDPSDAGLDFHEVEFPTPIGSLRAWQIDAGDGSIWAIHAHGWRAGRREAVRFLPTYHDAGVTSLVIDYRNDPGAPDDPSGLYRFGRTEWEDVEAAVTYARDHGAQHILLVGYSTGCALELSFLERSDLSDLVDAAIFDSPNIDMETTVRFEAARRNIPGTPVPVPSSLTSVAILMSDLRWDVGWDQIDYAERAGEIVHVPILVFHGLADRRVPVDVSRRLRDNAPDEVQLIEVQDGGHVNSWNVDPEAYERALAEFLGEATG